MSSDLTALNTEDLEEIRAALDQRIHLLAQHLTTVQEETSQDLLDRAGEKATDLLNRVKEELAWR